MIIPCTCAQFILIAGFRIVARRTAAFDWNGVALGAAQFSTRESAKGSTSPQREQG